MIGEKLGPFLIEEKLGAGAMGVVYRGTHEDTGQAVALKVIAQETAGRGNAAERFERESDILKQFRHRNIVQHIGTGHSRSRGLRYYAMEYVPGEPLDRILERRGALPWVEVVNLAIPICDALQYAHQRGVVHRDLKPSNLMISTRGEIKLADFGIAKDLDRTTLTADGRTLGTAAYMAPEQIRGTPVVSHKTDLYALGCVLYQLLTGKTPFEGSTALQLMHKHLEQPPPHPGRLEPELPKVLDQLVVDLMAKERDKRPWDAQAVQVTLQELKDQYTRGDKIPLVHGDIPQNPTRLGGTEVATEFAGTERATADATAVGTRSRRRTRRNAPALGEPGSPLRARLEVAGLVLALAGLGGLVGYFLWPPSASYLHRQAQRLMAMPSRDEWSHALESYITPLETRFPGHPYQDDVRTWRDQILLADAEGRARFLETQLGRPRNEAETQFRLTSNLATRDIEAGRDLDALRQWQSLDKDFAGLDDDQPRQFGLLARKRARELEAQIATRRGQFESAMKKATTVRLEAEALTRIGNPAGAARLEQAATLLQEILREFGPFQSLAGPIATIRAQLATPEGAAPEPSAEPESAKPPESSPPAEPPAPTGAEPTPTPDPATAPPGDAPPPPLRGNL